MLIPSRRHGLVGVLVAMAAVGCADLPLPAEPAPTPASSVTASPSRPTRSWTVDHLRQAIIPRISNSHVPAGVRHQGLTSGTLEEVIGRPASNPSTGASVAGTCQDLYDLHAVLGGPDRQLWRVPTALASWDNLNEGFFVSVLIMAVPDPLRRRLTSARLPRHCVGNSFRTSAPEQPESTVEGKVTADTSYPIAETARVIQATASVDGGPATTRRQVVFGARGYLIVMNTITLSTQDSDTYIRAAHAHAEQALS
ncbi:hypothetical protein SMC26_44500 [Actinomadura fulvescens]